MTLEANKKIGIVLQNILEKYSLCGEHPVLGLNFDSDEIAEGIQNYEESLAIVRERELDNLLLILNGLNDKSILENVVHKHRVHHSELTITDTYVIDFPTDFKNKALAYIKELSGEYAISDKGKIASKLSLETRKNGLYLLGDRKNKEVRISDDSNSRQARLFKSLFQELGRFRTIDSTVEAMNLENDTDPIDPKELIQSRFKEIQSICSQNKTKTKFSLIFNDRTVAMVIK